VFWARVETKYTRHDLAELFGQTDFAPPRAVRSRSVMVHLHVRMKRREQIAQLSLQHHGSLRRASVYYRQVVLLCEVLYLIEIFLRSSVLLFQLLPLCDWGTGEIVCFLGEYSRISR
jgi:hypothetical protein